MGSGIKAQEWAITYSRLLNSEVQELALKLTQFRIHIEVHRNETLTVK